MNYILAKKEELVALGINNFGEELRDGRVIMPATAVKTIAGLTGVEIVSLAEAQRLIEESKEK